MKKCPKCKVKYPATLEYFYRDKYSKDGLQCWCKKCQRKTVDKYSQTKKGKQIRRKCTLKHDYGLTLEQYDKMFEKQNGVCAICNMPETGKSKGGGIRRLAVDHNHKTGKVRGLLCHNCNIALGSLKENKALILALALYLEKYRN